MAPLPEPLRTLLGDDLDAVRTEQVANLIKLPESQHLEFKRYLSVDSRVAMDVAAFANSSGGLMVFGVEKMPDSEHLTSTGIPRRSLDRRLSQVRAVLSELITPPAQYSIHLAPNRPSAPLVLIAVEPSGGQPHAVVDHDSYRFPVRSGAMTRFVDPRTASNAGTRVELKSALVLVDRPDADGLSLLASSTERLMGEVRYHLQEGTWSHENGYQFGVEDDVRGDLEELERQLRPLSGRPPNMTMVQGYVTQLSKALMDVAERQAGGETRDHLESLRSGVIDKLSHFDGTSDDIGDAIEALEALSYETTWADVEPPDTASQEDWDEFVRYASDHRRSVAETIIGWTPVNRQEAAGAVIGAMTVAGGIGFLASSVATWAGGSAAGAAGFGAIIGLVGAIVGAVLGVLATRFVPRDAAAPPES